MLQDYQITKKPNWISRLYAAAEFILILFIIYSAVTLFAGAEEEEEAIRFRILSHSNAPADQAVKEAIHAEIAPLITKAISNAASIEEMDENLKSIEPLIYQAAAAKANGRPVTFERKAALFPPKRTGLYISPAAVYDAYVLTIGSGRGDNWWCSLFPNVCFPEAEKEAEQDDKPVKFFLYEWITSLFS